MHVNYVYILECSDTTLYTGWTTDIERRLQEHNSGLGAKYTRGRHPVILCYLEEFDSKEEAMSREFAIKRLARAEKLKLIKEYKRHKAAGEGGCKMTDTIQIREAFIDDAAALLDYLKEIGSQTHNLTFGPEGIPFTVEEEKRFLMSMQTSHRSRVYLAVTSPGEIVGNATIQAYARERMKHRANIAISVKMSHWGQGIASALMQKMIDFAGLIDVELITLEVLSENSRAISLYERFGFEKFACLEHFYKIDKEYYSADYMKLEL